ncbi:hypothetical protein B7Z28_00310 [Candidatus Saccharibacteria bacterium 32-45-3]|nr:MAG: hypothetical protein B7Z28_00310 [Candidatus Saccharibacteria bacterium 32-45-3]
MNHETDHDDPPTEAQLLYMEVLAADAGEPTPTGEVTKEQAKQIIHELREKAHMDNESHGIDSESDPNLDIDDEQSAA